MTTALEARQVLADEWLARDPQTPAEINAFYRTAEHLAPDLEAFHADPARQAWTSALVQTAQQYLPLTETKLYIDIGAGLGHDLRAVREAVPEALVVGVEPSHVLVAGYAQEFAVWADAADAPIEGADLLSCIDVLEHVPEPETWLGDIARRAKVNAVLLETCATFDFGTPLHLRANAGWHPGRVLEANGWQQIGATGRMRYWQKRPAPVKHTSLMIAAYRGVATDTFLAIVSAWSTSAAPATTSSVARTASATARIWRSAAWSHSRSFRSVPRRGSRSRSAGRRRASWRCIDG
jgi:SAM-dependent methyltransferase